jgi:hypothetical protein
MPNVVYFCLNECSLTRKRTALRAAANSHARGRQNNNASYLLLLCKNSGLYLSRIVLQATCNAIPAKINRFPGKRLFQYAAQSTNQSREIRITDKKYLFQNPNLKVKLC